MNKPIQNKRVTLAGTKMALYEMMQQNGLTFPITPADVERIEAGLDDSRLPTPDVNNFLQFLRGIPLSKPSVASKVLLSENAELLNGLALAARNGGGIDADIRKRMDEDRNAAEAKTKK